MSEYQHRPDQGPGGDKQFLLYMMLAFVLVVMLQGIFSRQAPKPANTPATPPAVNTQPSPTPAPPAAEALAAVPQNVQSKQASAEGDVTVEDDLFRVVLTNRGAQAKSWQLKKYKNDKGQTLDLVNQKGADLGGWPLSLWTYDEALRKRLNEALYVVSVDGCKNVSGQTIKVKSPAADQSCEFSQQMSLTYDFADADLSAHKKITFESGYVVAIEAAVLLKGVPVPAFPAWPSSFGDQVSAANYASSKVDWHTAEGNNHLPAFEKNIIRPNKWVMGGATLRNEFNWIGASDEYFAAVFMPANPRSAVAVTLNQPLEIPKDPAKPDPNETVKVPVVGVAVGDVSGITGERLYVGPKDFDVLRRVRSNGSDGAAGQGPNLEGVVDFGTFGIFARWLFDWLNWTHDHLVQNWGWAIIVLTVIINLALLPTRVSMMRTQLKMQKVAPFAQAINKKYEKYGFRDTEKQQQKQAEIMAMYKEHDVSPFNLAGCLPMFIQLPILYAFYAVLANTIELRQAAWMWIRDLSSPDPWHILPIATIASMMILQRMTPQAGMDPAQRRMMNVMMPVMFGFITWAVSAGLALYWTVGNLISLGQQYVMNRTHLGREIQELQAKRARKSQK